MNSLKKIVSAVAVGATVLVSVGSAAQAGDWGRRGPGYGHGHGYAAPAYRPNPYYGHGHQNHSRDRRGDRIATGVAIGVGALILGSILANQSHRNNGYHGY